MAPSTIHLPDGQNFTVTPVFGGLFFKSNELNMYNHSPFPIGWTVVLNTDDKLDMHDDDVARIGVDGLSLSRTDASSKDSSREPHIHSYRKPTLQNDNLFISSISNPSSADFKPSPSPTRQIALMLYITLYWYFHQPEPSPVLHTAASRNTPESGKPHGEWRINIKRDGVLRGRNLIPKLERMGLIMSYDSSVGSSVDEASTVNPGGNGATDDVSWSRMFVTRRIFWQIPGRLFLFTLQPNKNASSLPGSPTPSRPTSPANHSAAASDPHVAGSAAPRSPALRPQSHHKQLPPSTGTTPLHSPPATLVPAPSFPIGPYFSSSHLPTYYPPAPPLYMVTNNVRHPVRPKPPRMGEIFYTRFVPSAGQYLSFRVASSSPKPVPYLGPVSESQGKDAHAHHLARLTDTALLQTWLANPRVRAFWGGYEEDMLPRALASRHSFPAVGLWDGVPFGYFEIYWAREDALGTRVTGGGGAGGGGGGGAGAGDGGVGDWDRGFHVLVGEEWARGRVHAWLSSLVHWAWCQDPRTMSICLEPRVDNERFIQHLQFSGFAKEKQISFPHKQAWFCRLRRDAWEGPAL